MIPIELQEVLYFIVMGTFGAALYVIVNAESWEDFTKFESLKHMLLGPFIGFFYNLLYSEHSFPNAIMCIVAGYSGSGFIIWVMDLLKKTWEAMKND